MVLGIGQNSEFEAKKTRIKTQKIISTQNVASIMSLKF